jgi:hypothetical protein
MHVINPTNSHEFPAGIGFAAIREIPSRDDAVEKLNRKSCSCDAPVAERAGDASSPEPLCKPNGVAGFSRDEDVAPTFCDEASQLHAAATASFRTRTNYCFGTGNFCCITA